MRLERYRCRMVCKIAASVISVNSQTLGTPSKEQKNIVSSTVALRQFYQTNRRVSLDRELGRGLRITPQFDIFDGIQLKRIQAER